MKTPVLKINYYGKMGAVCASCGFRYFEHNGHIIPCPICEIATYLAELARLYDTFPCGHRKIDWDDSYGECAVCKIKEVAGDYDNLPHTVIECHDKIADLERERDGAEENYRLASAERGHAQQQVMDLERKLAAAQAALKKSCCSADRSNRGSGGGWGMIAWQLKKAWNRQTKP